MCLVVVKPFGNFLRGEVISDPEEITSILRSEQKKFVVKIAGNTVDRRKV